jgi:hypothetical protein
VNVDSLPQSSYPSSPPKDRDSTLMGLHQIPAFLLTCRMYRSSSAPSPYSNFLLLINSKKCINNYYFKIPQLRTGLPTHCHRLPGRDGPTRVCKHKIGGRGHCSVRQMLPTFWRGGCQYRGAARSSNVCTCCWPTMQCPAQEEECLCIWPRVAVVLSRAAPQLRESEGNVERHA